MSGSFQQTSFKFTSFEPKLSEQKSRHTLAICSPYVSLCMCDFSSSSYLCHFHSPYGFATSFSFFSAFVLLCLFQFFSVFLLCHWFYLSLSLHISEFIVIFSYFFPFLILWLCLTPRILLLSL
jgi:hypothetical protein